MAIVAQSQLTISDLNDMPPVSGKIGSNHPRMQTLSTAGAYLPAWNTTNLVLQPDLFKAGGATDLIANNDAGVVGITWFYKLGTAAEVQINPASPPTNVVMSKSSSPSTCNYYNILTINSNVMNAGSPNVRIRCVVDYKYNSSMSSVPINYDMDFALAQQGATGNAATFCLVSALNGDTFVNAASGDTLTLNCDLILGGVVQSAGVTYQWQIDSSGFTNIAGATSKTYAVPKSSVNGAEMFKCIATYASVGYSDVICMYDRTDPIQVAISSTGGDTFKQGVGSSVLTADLYQQGTKIDAAGTGYTYAWKKYDKNAALVPTWKPAVSAETAGFQLGTITTVTNTTTFILSSVDGLAVGYKVFLGADATAREIATINTGTKTITTTTASTAAVSGTVKIVNYKSINISDPDVDEKGTFVCEVYK